MTKLAIVILNWNGKHWLEKFLPNVIANSLADGIEIFVADNGSDDDSVSFVKQNFAEVKILELGANYGYTGGYNRALIQIKAEYFLLLNSDIEVTHNWLTPLLKRMDENAGIGACQPKILSWHEKNMFEYAGASGGFIDKLGYPFCRGRIFDTIEEDKGQYNDAVKIFWATGACLLVRADAFFKAGMLDDEFFAHMEEIDLCWRMQNLGYEIWVEPASVVYHVGGGTLHKSNPKKTFLNFRNNLALLYKNLPSNKLFSTIFLRLILDGLAGVNFLLKGQFADIIAIIKAHFAFYGMLPYLKRKRNSMPETLPLEKLNGISKAGIVKSYYLNKIKAFSQFI